MDMPPLSTTQANGQEKQEKTQPRIQIYSTSTDEVSAFWKEKYEKDAKKYWDIFYKRHQDKFFKDRHYLDKEWGGHFSGEGTKVILEVGCGAGNTIYPLLETYPDVYVHACDFSTRAVTLVKMHKDFTEARVNPFVCDLTIDDLCQNIAPASVDIVTMIFVLSAVSPDKMPVAVQNIRKVLKPNGRVLFRDYATGDLAQERLTGKEQKISENFYVRGDGTRVFYFSDEFLDNLFKQNGYIMEEHRVHCKQVENRSREIVMNRRWVQAVFQAVDQNCMSSPAHLNEAKGDFDEKKDAIINGSEIDMSEGLSVEMFGISSSCEEIVEVAIKDYSFKIKLLSKEYQHTCTSTGLMLWESAQLMASILASNPEFTSGKKVLELGCGCTGICSMIASKSADIVVATDGDPKSLDLLTENISLNNTQLYIKKLEWGNESDITEVKKLSHEKGFDVIIGTDVTYVAEAIMPLFETAKELINRSSGENEEPACLVLCHVFRRVDEPYILSVASQYGFKLVERWPDCVQNGCTSESVITRWFSTGEYEVPSTALNIMYFCVS